MKLGGVVRTWQDFQRGTKRLIFAMFLFGVFLLALGVVADIYRASWLEDHAFMPNVLAGFIGFLIGVPVALVGLATITGQREEKAATDRIEALSLLAWHRFRDSVREFCNNDRYLAIIEDMEWLYIAQLDAYGAVNEYIQYLRAQKLQEVFDDPSQWGPSAEYHFRRQEQDRYGSAIRSVQKDPGKLYAEIIESHIPFSAALSTVLAKLGLDPQLRLEWSMILGNWNTLDQYVRIQRLERGLDWFNSKVDAAIRNHMNRQGNPLADLSRKLELTPLWVDPISYGDALETMDNYVMIEREALDELLLEQPRFFGHAPIGDQFQPAEEAAAFIFDLRCLVEKIDKSNWLLPLA